MIRSPPVFSKAFEIPGTPPLPTFMFPEIQRELQSLYQDWSGQPAKSILPVSAHGSGRQYFRILGDREPVIGVLNPDRRENIAFLKLSAHFKRYSLPVPEIHIADLDRHLYLEQDLGDETLFTLGGAIREREGFSNRLVQMYKHVVEILP